MRLAPPYRSRLLLVHGDCTGLVESRFLFFLRCCAFFRELGTLGAFGTSESWERAGTPRERLRTLLSKSLSFQVLSFRTGELKSNYELCKVT